MEKAAASSAGALVRRARGITVRHHVLRALFRGVAAGALLAGILAAAARLLGYAPGAWIAIAALPALAVVAIGLRRARIPLIHAAVLLDRAAGTRERFLATLTARDPEIRDLAAEQALADPGFEDGACPLRFPPTTEGLAAAFATALLLGVLLLPGGAVEAPGAGSGGSPLSALPGQQGVPPHSPRVEDVPGDRTAPLSPEVDRVTTRMAAGEEIDADDWKTLEAAGLAKKVRGEVAAALERGEPGLAAQAVRRALRRGRGSEPKAAPVSPRDHDWGAYQRAIEAPIWSPQYDAVVRRYFTGAAKVGLR